MTSVRFFFVDVFAHQPLSGNPLVVVPDADHLSVPQMQAMAREFNQSETTFILVPDLDARFFNPTMGLWEDPATGTAAGPLATRLVAEGVVPDGGTVVVEQGHSVGRPSQLLVTVSGDLVRLSGAGLIVADGTLHL